MAKKKEDDLTGTCIKLSDLENKFLNNFIERRLSAEMAFEVAADNIRDARNVLWDAIFDFYPDLKKYHNQYNSKRGEIAIIGKKRNVKD